MAKFYFFITITFLIFGCGSLSRQKDLESQKYLGKELWTKTNLHLFEKQYLYWQNYLSGELLPVGTTFRLKEVYTKEAILTDNSNNDFILYWKADETTNFKDAFDKYFLEEDPKASIQKMNVQIVESISLGEVKRGMSKRQTIISLGYPPRTTDPYDKDIWIYWESEFRKRAIYFEDDKVTNIVYSE
ncbi:hypothetical protein [Candidatus Uabimicrobium sp. HlEnr_7]|uniref:hypothetical protein n=1 Tax=Candidatus Uabimicrobium helgolandensis TaxID=3095367 RepID=UPI003557892B